MDLEGIMLSEVSQTEKGKYHMIDTLYMQNLKYNKLINSYFEKKTKTKTKTHI